MRTHILLAAAAALLAFAPASHAADHWERRDLAGSGGMFGLPAGFHAAIVHAPRGATVTFLTTLGRQGQLQAGDGEYAFESSEKDKTPAMSGHYHGSHRGGPLEPLALSAGEGALLFASDDHGHPLRGPLLVELGRFEASERIGAGSALVADSGNSFLLGGLPIISRAGWGADEEIRFFSGRPERAITPSERDSGRELADFERGCTAAIGAFPDEFELERIETRENGRLLRWPHQYTATVRKIVLHHTAENGVSQGRSSAEVMRAMYRYHAVSRRWGDIGYHFVIDPNGQIFEGRSGGARVVGGHAACHNIGTVSVALMGNFENHGVPSAQMAALEALVVRLSGEHNLDPTATEWFRGEKTPNLLPHSGLTATACPGKNLFERLPELRRAVEQAPEVSAARKNLVDGEFVGPTGLARVEAGARLTRTFSFRNTGNASWGAGTWLFGQSSRGVKIASKSSTRDFVAAHLREKTVAPGEIGHFEVSFEAGYSPGVYAVSLVPVVAGRRLGGAETLAVFEVAPPDFGVNFGTVAAPRAAVGKAISVQIPVRNSGQTIMWKADSELRIRTAGRSRSVRVPFSQTLSPRAGAVFSAKIPGVAEAGPVPLLLSVFVGGVRAGSPALREVLVGNQAPSTQIQTRSAPAVSGEFSAVKRFQNDTSQTWRTSELKLVALRGPHRYEFFPQSQADIPPQGEASFAVQLPPETSDSVASLIIFLLYEGEAIRAREVLRTRNIQTEAAAEQPTILAENKESQEAAGDEPLVRVRISYSPQTAFVRARAGLRVLSENDEVIAERAGGDLLSLSAATDGQVEVGGERSDFVEILAADGSAVEIASFKRVPAWDAHGVINDNRFLGSLRVYAEGGKLLFVNHLPLEQYLRGVAEVPEAQHPEKKRALAILARSYAAFYALGRQEKFSGETRFNASDDPNEFQKYLGENFANRAPGWIAAVENTRGAVLTYQNELIKPPYHSCAGGQTSSAQQVWGWTDAPYLASVPDHQSVANQPRAGHGVGLSGCGAQAMATDGQTAEQILEYFYRGVEMGTNGW